MRAGGIKAIDGEHQPHRCVGKLGDCAQAVTGYGSRHAHDRHTMSDEDIITLGGQLYRAAEHDDFEETLEILIRLAQSERREFLAYLLRMALIEARSQAPEKTCLPH
jgi:hypothetical protein